MVQFDVERTALAQHLVWLASAAARLKVCLEEGFAGNVGGQWGVIGQRPHYRQGARNQLVGS
jgi:hypothetical protein